jgi:hypothetical protein
VIIADAGAYQGRERAMVDLLRARIAFASRRGSDAPTLLLKAARELERVDPEIVRATYLDALSAARFARGSPGPLATGADLVKVSEAALAGPALPRSLRPPDLLLQGLALLTTEGVRGWRATAQGRPDRLQT